MRYHLQGRDIPEYDKLSELAKNELKTKVSLAAGQHILGR